MFVIFSTLPTEEVLAPEVVAPEEEVPQELQIVVEYLPPRFTQVLEDIEIVEGEKATFEAVVEGHEPIEVTWYKDTVEIEVGAIFQFLT